MVDDSPKKSPADLDPAPSTSPRAFTLRGSIHAITYPLLLVYFAPILVLWWVAIQTDLFKVDLLNWVPVARALSNEFFEVMRSTLAAVFVPFVMAYAVKDRQHTDPIPLSTLILFFAFLALFVIAASLYGLIQFRKVGIERAGAVGKIRAKTCHAGYEH